MYGTVKRSLERETRKPTWLDLYKIMALSCLLYDSETGILRTDERRLTAAETRFLQHVGDYTVACIALAMK
jgi:hypothetical protein